MKVVKAKGKTFSKYFLDLKNMKMYSLKYGAPSEVKPLKNYSETAFKLYENGQYYVIKLSEILAEMNSMQ